MPRFPGSVRVKTSIGMDQEWTVDNLGDCRYCGMPVFWCVTQNGKRNPVDTHPDDEGLHESHFSTCPKVKHVRRDFPKSPPISGRDRAAGEK